MGKTSKSDVRGAQLDTEMKLEIEMKAVIAMVVAVMALQATGQTSDGLTEVHDGPIARFFERTVHFIPHKGDVFCLVAVYYEPGDLKRIIEARIVNHLREYKVDRRDEDGIMDRIKHTVYGAKKMSNAEIEEFKKNQLVVWYELAKSREDAEKYLEDNREYVHIRASMTFSKNALPSVEKQIGFVGGPVSMELLLGGPKRYVYPVNRMSPLPFLIKSEYLKDRGVVIHTMPIALTDRQGLAHMFIIGKDKDAVIDYLKDLPLWSIDRNKVNNGTLHVIPQ